MEGIHILIILINQKMVTILIQEIVDVIFTYLVELKRVITKKDFMTVGILEIMIVDKNAQQLKKMHLLNKIYRKNKKYFILLMDFKIKFTVENINNIYISKAFIKSINMASFWGRKPSITSVPLPKSPILTPVSTISFIPIDAIS